MISAVICLCISAYGYLFIYNKSLEQARSYTRITQEVNSEDGKKKYEQELFTMYETSKSSRDKIASFIINNDGIVNFIEMIEKIGESTNTDLELSSINNEKDHIKAKINVKGSWSNVMRALILIENIPLSASISNISLVTSLGLDKSVLKTNEKIPANNSNIWNLSMDIESLIFK